jgi:hypothetical protein
MIFCILFYSFVCVGGYCWNFGIAGSIWSHGCASEIKMSICGRNQLGSAIPTGQNANKVPRLIRRFRAGNARAALRAKTAFVLSAGQAWSEMIAQFTSGQLKRLCRHEHGGREPATRDVLAIATMAFEHHNWLSRAFVTNRAANAATSKRNLHREFYS